MAFRCWQMGLHIQQDNVFIVALQRTRSGWGYAAGGNYRYRRQRNRMMRRCWSCSNRGGVSYPGSMRSALPFPPIERYKKTSLWRQ